MESARLRKFEVWFENSKEYHSLKREIFGEDIYYAEFDKSDPVIFDVGAHIGLATLYFKMIYSQAKITAIEPHPALVKILKKNILWNRLDDIEVIEGAVGGVEGERKFYIDKDREWLSSGSFSRRAWNGQQENVEMEVWGIDLKNLINSRVDLLKLDVEGAEEEVLVGLGEKLRMIDRIMFEYHPTKKKSAKKIVDVLRQYGFSVSFTKGEREVDWEKTNGLLLGEAIRK